MTLVGFLGLGEAGSLIAADLAKAGVTVRGWDPLVPESPGVETTDGPDAVEGTTLLVTFMDANGSQSSVPWNVGEDHDRFVRTEQGWRFASRSYVNLFARGDTIDIP